MKSVTIGNLSVGNDLPLTVIAGPCQLESFDHAMMIAETMAEICAASGARYVFKASYDKANRTSLAGKRGLGIDEGLSILSKLRDRVGCPVLTDVHTADQCGPAAASSRHNPDPPLSCVARPICCWPRARQAR